MERGVQRAGQREHRAHHQHTCHVRHGNAHRTFGKLNQIQGKGTDDQHRQQGHEKVFAPHLVVQKSHHACHHRSAHDNHGHRNDKAIPKAQRFYDEVDQIGKESLLRNTHHAGRRQANVHHLVGLRHRGFKAVEGILQVAFVFHRGKAGFVFEQRHSQEACHKRNDTQHQEEQPVVGVGFVVQRAQTDEDDHHRHHRQHRQHGIHLATVGGIRHVRHPSVKCGVVGGRAHQGHHAVQHHQKHRYGRNILCGGRHGDKAKQHDGNTPQNVADTNKGLALAQPIAPTSRKNTGSGGGQRRGNHHHGGDDIAQILPSRVEENILRQGCEIHIFHHPRNLTDQTKQQDRNPHPAAQAGRFDRLQAVCSHISPHKFPTSRGHFSIVARALYQVKVALSAHLAKTAANIPQIFSLLCSNARFYGMMEYMAALAAARR